MKPNDTAGVNAIRGAVRKQAIEASFFAIVMFYFTFFILKQPKSR